MKTTLILVWVAGALALSGCQGADDSTNQSSSSTNWLTCDTDQDCTRVESGARCADDGYCEDAEGNRIEVEASLEPAPPAGEPASIEPEADGDPADTPSGSGGEGSGPEGVGASSGGGTSPGSGGAGVGGVSSAGGGVGQATGGTGGSEPLVGGAGGVAQGTAGDQNVGGQSNGGQSNGGQSGGGQANGGSSGEASDTECEEDCAVSGFTCCNGRCVNLANDPFNCGECGTVCTEPNSFCNGMCMEPACEESCSDGQMCCIINLGPTIIECSDPVEGTCPMGCPFCLCAAFDSPVATPSGERRIDELSVGDRVYSIEGDAIVEAPIVQVRKTAVHRHELVRVALSTGRVVEMSAGHPTADGKTFGNLDSSSQLGDIEIESVAAVEYTHPFTYDILPATSTGVYFVAGAAVGSTLHEPSAERVLLGDRGPLCLE